MNESVLTVGLIQQAAGPEPANNLTAAEDAIRNAAGRGAHLILLQELFATRYFCQQEDPALFDLAQPVPGPISERLGRLAGELGVVIVGSVFERRAPGLYHNTAVVLDADGSLTGRYRKMHIPDDPGYFEKFYFTPGDLGFEPIPTSLGRLGVLVCWDQWYPEAARLMALAGADMLLFPTAIGWDPADDDAEQVRQREAWITVQRSHAIANGLPVLSCNRTGFEPDPSATTRGIDFWGSSFVSGPQGEILAMASQTGPELLLVDIDRSRSEEVRRIWPYLRDRRIDAYQDLSKRYRD